jgi:hypothetical protein
MPDRYQPDRRFPFEHHPLADAAKDMVQCRMPIPQLRSISATTSDGLLLTHLTVDERLFQVFLAIVNERAYQDQKWGNIDEHVHVIERWIEIAEEEVSEAKVSESVCRGDIKDVLCEILQAASVLVACMEQYGTCTRMQLRDYNNQQEKRRRESLKQSTEPAIVHSQLAAEPCYQYRAAKENRSSQSRVSSRS